MADEPIEVPPQALADVRDACCLWADDASTSRHQPASHVPSRASRACATPLQPVQRAIGFQRPPPPLGHLERLVKSLPPRHPPCTPMQIHRRLVDKKELVERELDTLGTAPTELSELLRLCRGFEAAFVSSIKVGWMGEAVVLHTGKGDGVLGEPCMR